MSALWGRIVTESALYQGKVFHQRFTPTKHRFEYSMSLFWLKLSELDELSHSIKGFSYNQFNWCQFNSKDYIDNSPLPIQQKVHQQTLKLGFNSAHSEIFFLGQIRSLGVYFSPVNFYFFRESDGHFSYMMAEVTNTPWHEKHCYLVNLDNIHSTRKCFHVSPFNPMQMDYHWQIQAPSQTCNIALSCHRQTKHFTAGLQLFRKELNSKHLRRVLINTPSMSVKTMVGIYWQAFKLFLKGTPIYSHPTKGTK